VRRVAAVIPVFRSSRLEQVVLATLPHVDEVVLVDDGAPAPIAARADALAAAEPRITLLRRAVNGGKGAALADAYAALLARPDPPDAVLSLDSDGQHPPDRIPAFLAAAEHADIVIGDRRGRRAGGMPLARRAANAATSTALSVVTRRWVRDSQNGMRLVRTGALRDVPLVSGGFEAETRHLKALIRHGADVGWVALRTIYAGEPSSFRPVRDSLRIGRELLRRRAAAPGGPAAAIPPPRPAARAGVLGPWWPRLALGLLALVAAGLALPAW
jgi:glycosyltransferase involved in cell wall biosynthesis